ncbi:MAG: sigma-54 dependent transcriptional regulator [Gemmatimonadota bacterium]
MRVLVVDDDAGLRKSLSLILGDAGYTVQSGRDATEGLKIARDTTPDLILVDVRMPGMDGLAFLGSYRESGGTAPVVVMTAYGNIDVAVDATRKGAADFIAKPFGGEEILLTLKKVEERERLRNEVGRLRQEVRTEKRYGEIVARSPEMVRALEVATKVAQHPTSILITGPTGTGKELLARLIHRESARASAPFVAVNCGAIPEGLLESQFFGYVKGAFSGADSDREGLFEAANGGTLFLDEVGELPESLQVKLLRALQEGEIRRVGDTKTREADVRIVAATNRLLETDVGVGRFREDLYYRIAVVTVALPPLKDRPEDLPLLVHHLLDVHRQRLNVETSGVERPAMDALLQYSWPGNVRELGNVLERALVLCEGPRIRLEDLPLQVREPGASGGLGIGEGRDDGGGSGAPWGALDDNDLSVKRRSAELERQLIQTALRRTGGHRGKSAALLDLSDRALRYKIREYGLE